MAGSVVVFVGRLVQDSTYILWKFKTLESKI